MKSCNKKKVLQHINFNKIMEIVRPMKQRYSWCRNQFEVVDDCCRRRDGDVKVKKKKNGEKKVVRFVQNKKELVRFALFVQNTLCF